MNTGIGALLDDLLAGLRGILGTRLVGLYLYGSQTTDDFDADISDIDLLAVTQSALTSGEVESLRSLHQDFALANPMWADRLDVVYLDATALSHFRSEDGVFPVISPGEPFHLRQEPLLDWLQNWYIIRETGVVLFGPATRTIIPPITRVEFDQALLRYVEELRTRLNGQLSPGMESYIILTMCRTLHVHGTGNQISKRRGGLWMKEQHPEWSPLIDDAIRWRHEPRGKARPPGAATLAIVDFVAGQLRRTQQ